MTSLDQFRATGIDCADLGEALRDDSLSGTSGRLYLGVLYISRWEDGRHGTAPTNGPTWLLLLGNAEIEGTLLDLEARLYEWASAAGYFEPTA